jgi:hypothetical protein
MDSGFDNILADVKSNPVHAPLIESALRAASPMECDVVGSVVIADIVAGRRFSAPSTGRKLELMDVINGLASIAGLAQCAIAVTIWARARVADNKQDADWKVSARTALESYIKRNPQLTQAVANEPGMVDEILDVVSASMPS